MLDDYNNFCIKKLNNKIPVGFKTYDEEFHPLLFPYQKLIVKTSIQRGRYLIGAGCGLGKTLMQLNWADVIWRRTAMPVLIVAPLGAAKQTASEEAGKFGYKVFFCRSKEDIKPGINITNYEMIDKFVDAQLGGCILDESSILKNFTGSTRVLLKAVFKNTPYRLCCSATPAPNEFMELLNQADFLGVTETSKALANYFINDFKTGQWRLKGHATEAFWHWVCTWAVMMDKPSDIGFDDDDYHLPLLEENVHLLEVDLTNNDDESLGLFRDIELSATSYHHEKKITAPDRVKRCAEIASASTEQFIIWCDTNYEADLLKEAIPEATEVRGSHSIAYKEQATDDFKKGKIRVLISKASIFGYGMNFQQCHRAIFCGISYSYEDYYQALKRIHRYGQVQDVTVDIVIGKTEKQILDVVMEKARKQAEIKNQMEKSIKDIQIDTLTLKNNDFNVEVPKIELPPWL